MQKRILILICVLLLIINIAAAITFSKTEYQRRYNNLLNKAATYTTISAADRAFYQQHINDQLNETEKIMNDTSIPDEMKRTIINALNATLSEMESELNNPNIPIAQKITGIKETLQVMKTGTVEQRTGLGSTTVTGGNYSSIQKSYKCEVGQNLEGMCVYALPSYNVSLDVAKKNCGNYGMTFATGKQANKLSKYADIIYGKHSGETGSLFGGGYVWGSNLSGSYYTVLCVKDNNNITTSEGNYSPIQKSYKCDVGQRLEGMCVIPETSYNVSDSVAKSRCSKYGMTFATKDQVNKLAKHADIIYKGYPGEAGSLFVFGIVSGMNFHGSYYTVLCVKDNSK